MKNEDLVYICGKCPTCKVCHHSELCEAYYRQFNYYTIDILLALSKLDSDLGVEIKFRKVGVEK